MKYTSHVVWLFQQVLLGVILTALLTMASRSCPNGALQCKSVLGNRIELCDFDRDRIINQPWIVCDQCTKAIVGDLTGVNCNAVALRNWPDTEPLWLASSLIATRTFGLLGTTVYTMERDVFGNYDLTGKIAGEEVMYKRIGRRTDPVFRSVEVSACFELTITSYGQDGNPIHYTLRGPSKIVELKEPNLWIGTDNLAKMSIRPVGCRLNTNFGAMGQNDGGHKANTFNCHIHIDKYS